MALNTNNPDGVKSKLSGLVPPTPGETKIEAKIQKNTSTTQETKTQKGSSSKTANKPAKEAPKPTKEKKKMGRPKKENDEPKYNAKVDVYLTEEDKDKLSRLAKADDRSLGYFTRKIIMDYLEKN